jgi:orotidine-5'-phosphate decarboxylase
MHPKERIILALDVDRLGLAQEIVKEFKDSVGMFKVGKQLFTHTGPKIVDFIKMKGGKVFLDLKYHDIPNTVSKAAIEATKLGVDMFNIHASGGFTMMKATKDAVQDEVEKLKISPPIIIAVTVLTSLDDKELARMGINQTAMDFTRILASLAKEAGLDGVVSSGQEAQMIRDLCGKDFVIVTPGVRITEASDDQKRTAGPGEAVTMGATYLVLGRTVLQTQNPKEMLKKVEEEIRHALSR